MRVPMSFAFLVNVLEQTKTEGGTQFFQNSPVQARLQRIISLYEAAPKPCEARVLISGDDATLHATLCAFLHTVQVGNISTFPRV